MDSGATADMSKTKERRQRKERLGDPLDLSAVKRAEDCAILPATVPPLPTAKTRATSPPKQSVPVAPAAPELAVARAAAAEVEAEVPAAPAAISAATRARLPRGKKIAGGEDAELKQNEDQRTSKAAAQRRRSSSPTETVVTSTSPISGPTEPPLAKKSRAEKQKQLQGDGKGSVSTTAATLSNSITADNLPAKRTSTPSSPPIAPSAGRRSESPKAALLQIVLPSGSDSRSSTDDDSDGQPLFHAYIPTPESTKKEPRRRVKKTTAANAVSSTEKETRQDRHSRSEREESSVSSDRSPKATVATLPPSTRGSTGRRAPLDMSSDSD